MLYREAFHLSKPTRGTLLSLETRSSTSAANFRMSRKISCAHPSSFTSLLDLLFSIVVAQDARASFHTRT